jgi:hypothetical protein
MTTRTEITGLVYLAVGQRGLVLAHFMLHDDAAEYCSKIGDPELIVLPYNLNNRAATPAPLVGTYYSA